jgi:MGT family glycosyltransferase
LSTYLITSTPAHGHVMPLLQIARHLVDRGDRVRFLTSVRYADRVRSSGAEFLALPADADVDLDDADGAFPDRVGLKGPAAIRFDMLNLFVRPGAAQLAALRAAIADADTDAILTEPLFLGAALLQRRPRAERPPIVALGIFPLGVKSRDTAPFGLGVPPLAGPGGRIRNAMLTVMAERFVFGAVQRQADALSRREVGRPLGGFLLDWPSRADAVVQFTVRGFEYPRSDLPETVHFAGALPAPSAEVPLPAWWDDLDGSRPVVHVTQGTIANSDFGQLVIPTIEGLAGAEPLVVVSTGGRPVESVGADLPGNARVAEYLPYARLLPLVDVMVTNGGYGGVQQALSHGIPLVVAGQTEDKVEVSARVAWSGVGVNLKTNEPTTQQVAGAVRRVLADDSFRRKAQALAGEYAGARGLDGLDRVLASVTATATATAPARPRH